MFRSNSLKRILAVVMCMAMLFAVSAVGVHAVDDGTYKTHLQAAVVFPPHHLNFLENATVNGETITIPVPETVTMTVFWIPVSGHITDITMNNNPGKNPAGYVASVVTNADGHVTQLTITNGPNTPDAQKVSVVGLSAFSADLLFDVLKSNGNNHDDMPAVLTLSNL